MKKYSSQTSFSSLLFPVAFFISCNQQVKIGLSAGSQITNGSLTLSNTQGVKPDSSAQIDAYVVEIFEDKKGNLWFGTLSKGAARYDPSTGSLTYFSMKEGLCNSTVTSIAEDKKGNIWFGTHEGATKYDPSASLRTGGKKFTSFTESKGLHGAGCKILIDRGGNIWAGTNHGAFRYNGSGFSTFNLPIPEDENPSYKWEAGKVWDLMEDRTGNIWFARDGYGACKYDPSADTSISLSAGLRTGGTSFTHFTKKDGLCSSNVSTIIEDKEGNIWFGSLTSDFPKVNSEGGLTRYDGKTFTQFPDIKALTGNDIYTIYEDKPGNIWIGATHYGAYRYDGKTFTLFKETDRKDLTVNFGVQSILEDRNGKLWFGFSGGLFRFNGTSFTNITQDGPW